MFFKSNLPDFLLDMDSEWILVLDLCVQFLKPMDVVHVARCRRSWNTRLNNHWLLFLFRSRRFYLSGPAEELQLIPRQWNQVQCLTYCDGYTQPSMLPPLLNSFTWNTSLPRGCPLYFPPLVRKIRVQRANFTRVACEQLPASVEVLEYVCGDPIENSTWFQVNQLKKLHFFTRMTAPHASFLTQLQELTIPIHAMLVNPFELRALTHLELVEDSHFKPNMESPPVHWRLPLYLEYLCIPNSGYLGFENVLNRLDIQNEWPVTLRHLSCWALSKVQTQQLENKLDTLVLRGIIDLENMVPRGVSNLYVNHIHMIHLDFRPFSTLKSLSTMETPFCAQRAHTKSRLAPFFHLDTPVCLPPIPEGTQDICFHGNALLLPTVFPNHLYRLEISQTPLPPTLMFLCELRLSSLATMIMLPFPTLTKLTLESSSSPTRENLDAQILTQHCANLEVLELLWWDDSISSLTHLTSLKRFCWQAGTSWEDFQENKPPCLPPLPQSLCVLSLQGVMFSTRFLPNCLHKLGVHTPVQWIWEAELPSTLTKLIITGVAAIHWVESSPASEVHPIVSRYVDATSSRIQSTLFVQPDKKETTSAKENQCFRHVVDLEISNYQLTNLNHQWTNLRAFVSLHTLRLEGTLDNHDWLQEAIHEKRFPCHFFLPPTLQRIVYYDTNCDKRFLYLCDCHVFKK